MNTKASIVHVLFLLLMVAAATCISGVSSVSTSHSVMYASDPPGYPPPLGPPPGTHVA